MFLDEGHGSSEGAPEYRVLSSRIQQSLPALFPPNLELVTAELHSNTGSGEDVGRDKTRLAMSGSLLELEDMNVEVLYTIVSQCSSVQSLSHVRLFATP